MALSTISVNLIADSSITTAKIADDAVTSAKLGLTFSSGSATQDGTANNTTYDMVTGLTIPDKELIVVSFDFAGKSGENRTPVSYTHLPLPTTPYV